MNLKEYKNKPKGVSKLLSVVDSLVIDANKDSGPDERALPIDVFKNNLYLMVDANMTSAQDLLQTIDEVSDTDIISSIVKAVSSKFGKKAVEDESIWHYVQDNDLDKDEVMKFIATSSELPLEDKVIIADEILSAYDK